MPPDPSTPPLAFIASGKLYLLDGPEPRLVESHFVQEMLDRAERTRERNDWKQGSMSWTFSRSAMAGLQAPAAEPGARRVEFTGIAPDGQGGLYYALETGLTCGLFSYSPGLGDERRLFHRQQFRIRDLARRPADGLLAMSSRNGDATAHIALMAAEGRGLKQATDGDVVDELPSFDDAGRLLYQSAGLARDARGFPVAQSPYAILRLDLDSGNVETLAESPAHDCLAPRARAQTLYYIRRPYEPRTRVSPWRVLQDIALFPFRLARAVIHFLDFFSLMFSRKPLITAGGPPRQGPDRRTIMLWGKMIDAEKALQEKKLNGALVPRHWELIQKDAAGEKTIAQHVIAYDLCPDGSIIYTNGTAIHHLTDGAPPKKLCHSRLIERLILT